MAKNAYVIVTDLHDSDQKKRNRIDYQSEISDCKIQIITIGRKYLEAGYNPILLLLGDVFDRGFKDPDSSALVNSFWMLLKKVYTEIYSVLGNHEVSFYKSNPFYTLINTIESQKIRLSLDSKVVTPKGLTNTINVVDLIEDGEVCFHFNHSGCPLSKPIEGKINVGLYHLDICCREILDNMKQVYGNDIFEAKKPLVFDGIDLFDGFSYNFFGHMHKVYGTWDFSKPGSSEVSHLYYLGSLGRPNVTEVNDSFLERNLPVVLVEDGKFVRVEDNKIRLQSREQCVLESVVAGDKEAYVTKKELQAEKVYVPVGDNPINNLINRCEKNETLSMICDGLMNSPLDLIGEKLMREAGKLLDG